MIKWGSFDSIIQSFPSFSFYSFFLRLDYFYRDNFPSFQFSSVAQSCLTLCNPMDWSMPSPTPRAYSNSCPLSWWCHPTISSSVIPFSSRLQSFPASGFSNESIFHIRWPKYWSFSFSISPSSEYSGLISFMIDWLDLLAVQGTLKSLFQHHSSKVSILWHSALATLNFWIFFICGFVCYKSWIYNTYIFILII